MSLADREGFWDFMKFPIAVFAGMLAMLLLFFTGFGVNMIKADALFFPTYLFSFLGGLWTMLILMKWDRRI